jgi:hypothetical protein
MTAVLCKDYIIATMEYTAAQLQEIIPDLKTKIIQPNKTVSSSNAQKVYGYNPTTENSIT